MRKAAKKRYALPSKFAHLWEQARYSYSDVTKVMRQSATKEGRIKDDASVRVRDK